jgi:hypothetical protein
MYYFRARSQYIITPEKGGLFLLMMLYFIQLFGTSSESRHLVTKTKTVYLPFVTTSSEGWKIRDSIGQEEREPMGSIVIFFMLLSNSFNDHLEESTYQQQNIGVIL